MSQIHEGAMNSEQPVVTELLPCPFCGKPPKTLTNRAGGLVIFCNSLECEVLSVDGEAGDENENQLVIAAWNTRAESSLVAARKQIEQLTAALRQIDVTCSAEITERFGGHASKSEAELGRNSRIYALLVVPRNMARAVLATPAASKEGAR